MRCIEFESRLDEILDQRLSPDCDLWLTRHRRLCPRCRAIYESYEAMLAGLASGGLLSAELPASDEELAQRVVDAVQFTPSPSRGVNSFKSLLMRSPFLAAAAAVLIGLLLVYRKSGQEPTEVAAVAPRLIANEAVSPVAAVSTLPAEIWPAETLPAETLPAETLPTVPRPPAMGVLARQATARYADLVRDTGDVFANAMFLVPGVEPRAVARHEPSTTRFVSMEGAAEMAQGFRPVTASAASAVSFLLDVLPGDEVAPCAVPNPIGATPIESPDAT